MMQPSSTYIFLFDNIIGELISQICNNHPEYCVRNRSVPYDLYLKFKDLRTKANAHMSSQRLDRHKLASCMCGAILEVQPLAYIENGESAHRANATLALYAGLNIVKCYMVFDIIQKSSLSPDQQNNIKLYLQENFDMKLPSLSDNICDTQEYQTNLINALYWTHSECTLVNRECFHYDIWAYAKIFYHLELYNELRLANMFTDSTNKRH